MCPLSVHWLGTDIHPILPYVCDPDNTLHGRIMKLACRPSAIPTARLPSRPNSVHNRGRVSDRWLCMTSGPWFFFFLDRPGATAASDVPRTRAMHPGQCVFAPGIVSRGQFGSRVLWNGCLIFI
jgi:hypothetical protein